MDTTKIKRNIVTKQGVALFKRTEKREPNEADMKDINNPDADIEGFVHACMDDFAKQEVKTALEEMANAWLKAENDANVRKFNSTASLVDHLNFEVFRHRYPQITFENGGNRITVTIKE